MRSPRGQVVGMFRWDGREALVVKVMDEDVVKDEGNGVAVISCVMLPPCCLRLPPEAQGLRDLQLATRASILTGRSGSMHP
jgi:hypothetical protein